MFWRCLCLAACLALTVGNAHAQRGHRVSGPEGVLLTIGPVGPSPTLESVTAQLSEALARYDNSGINIREGLVRNGEEFATRAVPYRAARRLANDVSRSGALGGRVVLLQAGAALYVHELVNPHTLHFNGQTRVNRVWCGANGAAGYCLFQRRAGWVAAQIRSDSPYRPDSLGPFLPVSAPEFQADPSALAELPVRTEVFRSAGMSRSSATVARSLRIGDVTTEIDEIRTQRMRLGSLMVQFEPGPEPDTATISFAALDPADYQDELRNRARDILSVAN